MPHPSKCKGSGFERELVNQARELGLEAERAYASNGRALGCAETVDIVVQGCRVQAKRRRKIASDLRIPEGADAVAFREDNGESLVLIQWSVFLEKLKACGW